jgi:cell division protein FtsI (penicillin-binding protein 3)
VRLIERRIGFLFAVFLALLLIGGLKATWLGVVKAGTLKRAAAVQQKSDITVPAQRGAIMDRTGVELAVSEPAVTVAATPYLVKDPPAVAAKLARALGQPEDELLHELARRDTGFVYLARRVRPARAQRVQRMNIEGLQFIPEFERSYPRDWMASQLLGVTGTDHQGLSGLEYSLDEFLRGRDGERRLTKDALGDAIELRDTRPTVPGTPVRLTLDAAIQERAEDVLAEVGQQLQPKGATAIVMDPRNSEVLAMANWPSLDPTDLGDASEDDLLNRATGFTYEPGSTFKAITISAALEDRLVTPDTPFTLAPSIQVADRTIEDAEPRGTETLTVAQILAHSSNVGAITIGLKLGAEAFSRWISHFGFDRPTGVELPGEERGIVPPLDQYSGSTMGNLPIGQGLSVTPVQMVAAYAAIANGGVLRQPRLLRAVDGEPVSEPPGHRVIDRRVAAQVREMLEGVLAPGGTASEVSVPGYTLAGKTGTSEVAINGHYSETKYVASFIGFAPARDPKLLVAVIVDQPQGDIYGGSVAAPAFGEIASFALPYLGIAPE